jgi:hypothetical protein
MIQDGRWRVQFLMRSFGFFSTDLIFPAALMTLGSTQPLTEMSTRNIPRGRVKGDRRVGWPHRHLWASMACYSDRFTFFTSLLYRKRVNLIRKISFPNSICSTGSSWEVSNVFLSISRKLPWQDPTYRIPSPPSPLLNRRYVYYAYLIRRLVTAVPDTSWSKTPNHSPTFKRTLLLLS